MLLRAADRVLRFVEDALAGLILFAVLFIVTWELALRGFFGGSHLWTDELSRVLLIALVYVATIGLTRDGAHVSVEIVPSALGPRARAALERVADALCLVFALAATWYGIGYVEETRMFGISFAHSNLPFDVWVAQLVVPVAFGMISLRLALRLLGVRPAAPVHVAEG
ncbi:TRAP transporter small permease [Acuticoccus sp. I52.16.1]|uniref:TRAP transporter small permease n=1 Tax=Acuticoccus sp. I52.16.1 TaxID=2928472 RepID=UPI001FD26AD7|nr:TRAP transporter small permease subunit [Acuticoccus sp. I52.16.1]UOM37009.1 TRAP transporter small permease subunit [Acuticoccus sp. I52.16.1]